MAKSRSKKQPEFSADELDDLIFSPAVGSGVGSHLISTPTESHITVLPFPSPALVQSLQVVEDKVDTSLQPGSNLLPDTDLGLNQAVGKLLPDSDLHLIAVLGETVPTSNLPPDSNLLSGCSLPTDRSLLPDSNLPAGTSANFNPPSGSNLLPDGYLPTLQTQVSSEGSPEAKRASLRPNIPDSTLLSGSDLPICTLQAKASPEVHQQVHEISPKTNVPGSILLSGSDLLSSPSQINASSEIHSQADETFANTSMADRRFLSGSDLRTANGRVVRIRPAKSVQDAHTNGEHLLLTHMWKKGTHETEDTRLLKAGLSELARWSGSHKTSCRAYVRALIAKLAVEEAETFNASAGSEGARVYRVFSFATILERRRRTNMTHVIRTGAVSFVDPKTGERLLTDSSLPPGSTLHPASTLPIGSGSNHPQLPGSNYPPYIKNKEELLLRTSAICAAMGEYGHPDDDAISRLVEACRANANDCTTEEIVNFIHSKGALSRSKHIQNPIGFLIESVPKCFKGDGFRLRRLAIDSLQLQQPTEDDTESQREWGRQHADQLDDPSVPESVKELIRKCLAS